MTDDVSTYIGQKGYTIYKDSISIQEQISIRNELNVRPFIPKSPVQPNSFCVYRESNNKIYVPRYYGENTYGEAEQIVISSGDDINLNFTGTLRNYQLPIINSYMTYVNSRNQGGGLLEIPCGRGKTVMALNIISQIKKKTLIIVHKSFLLEQWIERIEEFLPGARIGKIQAQIIDIEDKDIVIAMLQSLSMKEYPQDMFDSFGLTIIDEVHHISAEVFVRSLFKVVTKNILGLSATMNRKDGLTRVFKMFIGDILYKEEREKTDNVLVKVFDYITNDADFNEIKYDYRGNPVYSSMISKLCSFNPRSEFILKVLTDLLNENPSQQIMILAHNKVLLIYLHDAIKHRNIAEVGYYIGGMKKQDLKASESKKVIIATYAMASEALDIKTLTTLIMATPKTDVTQSIGRILRSKDHNPLIIDFVDQHMLFKNQWKKRRAYYVKQNYRIIHTNNNLYGSGDTNIWTTLFTPGDKKIRKSCGKNKKDKYKINYLVESSFNTENTLIGGGKCMIHL
jgi:superfamily II DNA or RNA helicase